MDVSLPLLHFGATAAMAGVLWVVQLAVYPQFVAVGRTEFPAYHRSYTRGIGFTVGPLMLAELVTAVAVALVGVRSAPFRASLVILAGLWASTILVQVPLHNQLASGFDPVAHRRLVRTNWLRTLGWSVRVVLLLAGGS